MQGGYREGAGRKQGFAAKNAEEARKVLSEMVMKEIKPIGEALIVRAKNGDIPAIRELFDRAFGRAPQSMKLDSEDGILPIPIFGVIPKGMAHQYGYTEEEGADMLTRDDI